MEPFICFYKVVGLSNLCTIININMPGLGGFYQNCDSCVYGRKQNNMSDILEN